MNQPTNGASLATFSNSEFEINLIQDGEQFKVAAPGLARALGFREAHDLLRSVPGPEKGSELVRTPGGDQRVGYVTEPGFYRVMGQRQPSRIKDPEIRLRVERFQSWVYSEVLPSIRRHGTYMTGETIEQVLQDPDTLIQLATQLKDERAAREASERRVKEIEELRAAEEPKRRFADAVASAKNSMLIGEFAKILRANGVPMGQQRLFQWLRDQGLLCRQRGGLWNTPTQRAMDLGLFDVKETVVQHASGDTTVRRTPKLTGRGQVYLAERLLPDGDVEVA